MSEPDVEPLPTKKAAARPTYASVYVACVAALFLVSFLIPDGVISPEVRAKDVGKVVSDQFTELGKLITAIDAAVVVAVASLAMKGLGDGRHPTRTHRFQCMVAFLSCALSYYGTYLTNIALIQMFGSEVVDVFSQRLEFAMFMQYYCSLFGVVILGFVFFSMLDTAMKLPA